MAHNIPFAQANTTLGRPESMTAEECSYLECYQDQQYCITRWQLSDEELAEIVRNGGKLYLWFNSQSMPPVGIVVDSPFK